MRAVATQYPLERRSDPYAALAWEAATCVVMSLTALGIVQVKVRVRLAATRTGTRSKARKLLGEGP